jgi:beta-glucosidase
MSDFKTLPKLVTVAVAMTLAGTATATSNKDNLQLQESGIKYTKNAESMLKKLSLSEKLDILSGPGMDLTTYQGQDAINLAPEKDVSGVAGYINGVKNRKLDIPAVKLADGPAGLRIQPLREGDSNTYSHIAEPIPKASATGLAEIPVAI